RECPQAPHRYGEDIVVPVTRGRSCFAQAGSLSGSLWIAVACHCTTPTPNPSPAKGRLRPSSTGYGGGERAEVAVSMTNHNSSCARHLVRRLESLTPRMRESDPG